MVQLNRESPALRGNSQWLVKAAMSNPEVVKGAECGTGKESEFWMIAFGLEFTYNNDGNDDFVLCKASECARIGQQNAGIENECLFTCRRSQSSSRILCSCARRDPTRKR